MIFNMTGGSPLNFKVKAYASESALPATAAENTIAVITTTAITGYEFSADQPKSKVAGYVWICIGASSPIEFSATRKNPVMVYPISAKQYRSGWKNVTIKIYQNGAWGDTWDGTLFYNGDQYTKYTGGWWKNEDLTLASWSGENTGDVTIGKTMELDISNTHNGVAMVSTKNKIDVTNFKTLTVTGSANIGASGGCNVALHENKNGTLDVSVADADFNSPMDVSKISGSYYVSIWAYNRSSAEVEKVKLA